MRMGKIAKIRITQNQEKLLVGQNLQERIKKMKTMMKMVLIVMAIITKEIKNKESLVNQQLLQKRNQLK